MTLVLIFPAPKVRKQIVLDGPRSSGKSVALAMLAQWAREEGWLVLYVPNGRDWSHGGFYYKNPQTGLWDTPVQADSVLKASSFPSFFLGSRFVFLTSNVNAIKDMLQAWILQKVFGIS